MGCLRGIGCLVLVAAALAAGWMLRDRLVDSDARSRDVVLVEEPVVWEPLTDEGAERARRAIAALERSAGPVFASLRPGDLAAYLAEALARQLPPSAEGTRAAVIGDRVYVKSSVRLGELGGEGILGSLGGLVGERDTLVIGGEFDIVRPGLAQLRVREIRVRDFPIPERLIPRFVARIRRGGVPEGVAPDALPLEVPGWLADARVARGRITLYKNVP